PLQPRDWGRLGHRGAYRQDARGKIVAEGRRHQPDCSFRACADALAIGSQPIRVASAIAKFLGFVRPASGWLLKYRYMYLRNLRGRYAGCILHSPTTEPGR